MCNFNPVILAVDDINDGPQRVFAYLGCPSHEKEYEEASSVRELESRVPQECLAPIPLFNTALQTLFERLGQEEAMFVATRIIPSALISMGVNVYVKPVYD